MALIWAKYFEHLTKWKRFISITSLFIITIGVSSIPGGILWKIHDMQAGFFPKGQHFWNDLIWGAKEGLKLGWLIVLLSIPYNILGLVVGYLVTDKIQKKYIVNL